MALSSVLGSLLVVLVFSNVFVTSTISKIPKIGIEVEVLPNPDATMDTRYTYDTPIAEFADADDPTHPFLRLFGELHGKLEFKTTPVSVYDDCGTASDRVKKCFDVINSFRSCASDLCTIDEALNCVVKKYRTLTRLAVTKGSTDALASTFQSGKRIGIQTNVGLPFAIFTKSLSDTLKAKSNLADLLKGRDDPMYHVDPVADTSDKLSVQGLKNIANRMCTDNSKTEKDPDDENVNAKNFHAMLPKLDTADAQSEYPGVLTSDQIRCFSTGTGKPLPMIKDMVTGCVVEYRHVGPHVNSYMLDLFFGRSQSSHMVNLCNLAKDAWTEAKKAAKAAKKSQAGAIQPDDE